MLKITQKNELIENGSTTTISLNLMYGSEIYNEYAGKKFTFHSAGNYTYSLNGRETSGLFATSGVTIDLNYVLNLPDVTLTAAPNRNPLIEGNIVSYELKDTDLPRFVKAHNLSIKNVSTYNATLNTKEYINNNLDMEGLYANETFAITVSLNDNEEVNSLTSASENEIFLGQTTANNPIILKYNIYNANNILDNSKTRYVVITFTSDTGITIYQKIIINKEAAKAKNPVSSIVSGNRYQIFDDDTTSVSISKNASFTSQFVFDYIPDMYTNKYIVFTSNLPVGTTLTLYDYINDDNPTYWYYVVTKETNKIELTNFKKMGYQNTYYTYLTGGTKYKEIYLLNVDFVDISSSSLSNNNVHLEMLGKDVDDVTSINLTFNIYANRTFDLNMSDNITMGTNFDISLNMASSEGSETNYIGRKMAYVIESQDLPLDTYILYNKEKYYMNAYNKFIIPLDNVLESKKDITLSFNSDMSITNTVSSLTIALMISPNSMNENPLMGETVVTKNITLNYPIKKIPSFKVNNMNERVISKSSLKDDKTISLDYMDDGLSTIYVELQKKVGNTYQKVTDKLNRINGITKHDMGIFNISIPSGSSNIDLKLANTTECGTYRLVFTIKDKNGNTYFEIPYAFIVTD